MLPRVLFGTVLAFLLAIRLLGAPAWPHDTSDLPPDPAVRFGVLPNGLRYALASNPEPRDRVAFRLLVQAGSLHERDDQRGFAHFVEHMAFAGSRHFPPGTLVGVLQRHGFAFGADVSAFTFQTHTIYQLEASTDPARLAEALLVLRDFADGVSFEPAEVDRERGVVESERRARDNWQSRALDARAQFLHPDSLVAARNPIGDEALVHQATAAQLRELYAQWYRPDNLVLIAVGDAPLDTLVTLVRENFASLPAAATPLPAAPDPGSQGNPATLGALWHDTRETGALSIELVSVLPGRRTVETRASRADAIRADLTLTMLNERMNRLRRAHLEELGAAGAGSFRVDPLYTETSLRVDTAVNLAWQAIGAVTREWRLARDDGFTAPEIAEAATLVRRRFAYALTATQSSRDIAEDLAGCVIQNRVFSSWEQRAADTEAVLTRFDPTAARDSFRALWPGPPRLLVVGPCFLEKPEAALRAAFENGLQLAAPSTAPAALTELAYPDAAEPGAIRHRSFVRDLDLHLVEFANGIRLNLKRTDFRRNVVWLRARVGSGLLAQPKRHPGLGLVASAYVNEAGVSHHSGDELRRFLNARNSSLTFATEEDAFTFNGSSDTAGAPDLFRLLRAYLTDLAWRPSDFTAAQRQIGSVYSNSLHESAAALSATAARVIAADDSRLALPPPDQTFARSFDELMTWLEPALKDGPVEIGLVGDFDVEAILELAARTIGAMPRRVVRAAPKKPRFQPVTFSTRPGRWQTYVDTTIPRATVRVQWPIRGCARIQQRRRWEILGEVLGDLVRREIREKRGATYDPQAEVWNGTTDRDDGYLILSLSANPADASAISKDIARLGETLAARGATEEEFQAALQPRLADNLERLRDNSYWLYYVVACAQETPAHLDWPRTRESDYRQMTRADINHLAHNTLKANKAQLFVASPKP